MWNGLGRALLSLNKADEAVDAFKKAMQESNVDFVFQAW